MYILGLIFLFYCFLKLFFYGIFEIKEMNNKAGGISICFLASIGFIFPAVIIIHFFVI